MGTLSTARLNGSLTRRNSDRFSKQVTRNRLLHWELPNPLIVASSPLTGSGQAIKQLLDAGASAAVTKTITPIADCCLGQTQWVSNHLFNTDGYSRLSLEDWEAELDSLRGYRVIANIYAPTPKALANLAQRIEMTGVEVLELGLSCATKGDDPICFQIDKLSDCIKAVRRAVPNIGLLVKVQWEPSEARNRALARTISDLGADGISCCDTFPALLDVHKHRDIVEFEFAKGGLSGPALRPLVQRAVQAMADERPDLPVIAIGGVEKGIDVLGYLQSGACAVQVCTAILRHGRKWVPELITDILEAMDHHV